MDYTPDYTSWPAKLVIRTGRLLRSNKSFTQEAIKKNEARAEEARKKRLEKLGAARKASVDSSDAGEVNELGERDYSTLTQAATLLENKDHTDLIHGLTHRDSFDSLVDGNVQGDELRDPYFDSKDPQVIEQIKATRAKNEAQIAAVPADVWKQIASFLSPADAACLALTSRTLYEKVGAEHLHVLNKSENEHHKITVLNHMDRHLPRHLLCFCCSKFHKRTKPGKESLKADYVNNPLFDCPNTRSTVLPRMRLTHGRELPYSFVQLALRNNKHSARHGIKHESLSRQWKCKDSQWSHETRYMVHDGHLFVRVKSKAFAPPAKEQTETSQRHLLYDREEYIPYFSVCAHWQDGELMRVCKCALSHVPAPPQSYANQLKKGTPRLSWTAAHPEFIVRGCDDCRPARRCPECPTEYVIEVNMVEDKNDPVRRFKHALVVTRWSDLGNGQNPYTCPEWTSVRGRDFVTLGKSYDSFSKVGRRAVGGIFESKISGSVPGQRMISLNPRMEKLGEEGHGWY